MTTFTVGPAGAAGVTFNTIQEAVDAARENPGADTIEIRPGTFDEQVRINDPEGLTLRGLGEGVLIRAPAGAVPESGSAFGRDLRSVVQVTDSPDVTIQNLTVDGRFAADESGSQGEDASAGIAFVNSGGVIDDVVVRQVGNSQASGRFGLQNATSNIIIDNGGAQTVTVSGSTITDFQKTGILAQGGTVNLTGNTVTGIGTTDLTGQNGIQVSGTQGTISNNTISGVSFLRESDPNTDASGIIAFELTGATTFSGNTVTGTADAGGTTGLDLSDVVASVPVTISGNTFSGVDNGIFVASFFAEPGLDTDPSISGNTFTAIEENGIFFDPELAAGEDDTRNSTTTPFTEAGSQLRDVLAGSAGADNLSGLAGDDTLQGRGGNDTLDGGDGSDTAVFNGTREQFTFVQTSANTVQVTGPDGTDTVSNVESFQFSNGTANFAELNNRQGTNGPDNIPPGAGQDDISAGDGNDNVSSGPGNDNIDGGAGDDTLDGGTGDDVINGGAGNDTLTGGPGNDTVNGGAGDDTAIFNPATDGTDQTDLGVGNDVVRVTGANGQVRLSFTSAEVGNGNPNDSGTMTNQDGGLAVRFQVEDASGTPSGAVSRFDDEGITFVADAGTTFDVRDLVNGAARGDQFQVVVLGTQVGETLTAVQADRPYYINAGQGDDVVIGGNANDFLVGGAGADTLTGGAGADGFIGGVGADTVNGGVGNDTALFNPATDGADRTDLGEGDDLVRVAGPGQIRLTFTSAEVGNGNPNDSGTMTNQDGGLAVRFQAEDGADGLTGPVSRFDDEGITFVADGTATFDVRDLVLGAARGDQFQVVVLGTQGADNLTAAQASRPYYFNAGQGDDTVTGGTANDFLVGGVGADTLSGGAGDDTFLAGFGNDQVFGGVGNDRLEGMDGDDTLAGEDGDDTLLGGVGNDTLQGGIGADILFGGVGNDRLEGMDGDDTLAGEDGDDTLLGGVGGDTLQGGIGADILFGGVGNDRLIGEAGNDDINGEDGDDRLEGGDGLDTLRGGNGVDQLLGGNGADLLVGENGDDRLEGEDGDDRLEGGQGTDQLQGGNGDDQLQGGDGNDQLEGQAGNDRLQGEDGDDRLEGGDGADRLEGGSGNDQLQGGEGNDQLDGQSGNDRLIGERGDDTLVGEAGSDRLEGGEGADKLQGGIGDDQLQGGSGDDRLEGQSGADRLEGEDGADRLEAGEGNDVLQGGNGADTLLGGQGADTLEGQSGDDRLEGEDGDDRLDGGEGADTLQGGNGNDMLNGGRGDDSLDGQAGSDTFVFERNFGHDTVQNFQAGSGGDDVLQFSGFGGSFQEMQSRGQQSGGNTVFTFDDGSTLTLQNVQLSSLNADDFRFG